MDEFLSTPDGLRHTRPSGKMAPDSPGTSSTAGSIAGSTQADTLTQISAELAAIASNMLTKADKVTLVQEMRSAIREEIQEVRNDLTTLEQRVTELEADCMLASQHSQAADNATSRQGTVLLDLRRQVEDLDNRGRRNNIRVRGLPEQTGEDLSDILQRLFADVLGEEAPDTYNIERAHRALRPPRNDGPPRDIICCLLSFQLKEAIMKAARSQNITYLGAQVSLFQDLSPLTLEARRALRPLTRMLQDRRIPYRWGHPFSLQARKDNAWRTLRWPNEVPGFLRALDLPAVAIPNWILMGPPQHPAGPAGPTPPSNRRERPPRRGGPDGPEE
ncbi:Hypothetical predicted protein [Pelobates cultripes]|uniref:Uncharacterized protein n=2 Tax=Pelobates cultripes TaxID=61616 RepID=A0AAD1SXL6_PELCU|nr:Hypothetical predicted protein [Pelobates cultripes]